MILDPGFGEAVQWKLEGSCRTSGEHPDLWFSNRQKHIDKAKEICLDCPVMVTCLEWAIDKREEYGIWGGMDAAERREWKRDKR